MDSTFDRVICEQLQRNGDPAERMLNVVDQCERAYPHAVWRYIRGLDFSADLNHLHHWLSTLLSDRPPRKKITQLWFGLFHPARSPGPELSTDAFVEGRATEEQSKGFFARLSGSFYWPSGRYAGCEVVNRITKSFTHQVQTNLPEASDFGLNQCYLTMFVQHFAKRSPKLLLGSTDKRVIFTQYESMVIQIGSVEHAGFRPDFVWNYWNF